MKAIHIEENYTNVIGVTVQDDGSMKIKTVEVKPKGSYDSFCSNPASATLATVKQGVLLSPCNYSNKTDGLLPIHILSGIKGNQYTLEVHQLPGNHSVSFTSEIDIDQNGIPKYTPDCIFECDEYLSKRFKKWKEEIQLSLIDLFVGHLAWDDYGEFYCYVTDTYLKDKYIVLDRKRLLQRLSYLAMPTTEVVKQQTT